MAELNEGATWEHEASELALVHQLRTAIPTDETVHYVVLMEGIFYQFQWKRKNAKTQPREML